jgi:hypothetical protein
LEADANIRIPDKKHVISEINLSVFRVGRRLCEISDSLKEA